MIIIKKTYYLYQNIQLQMLENKVEILVLLILIIDTILVLLYILVYEIFKDTEKHWIPTYSYNYKIR